MAERRETAIVLGGGVGPMAGVAAHARIIAETLARDDRSHLTVYHFSRSALVPDRTKYLRSLAAGGEASLNPGVAMAEVFDDAARALPTGMAAVGGVVCNTFHAPPIFERFLSELAARQNPIRILSLLDETLQLLRERLGGAPGRRVGILSTTGTRQSGVYDKLLEGAGYRALWVDEAEQPLLHHAIYSPEYGLKAVSPPERRAVEVLARLAEGLVRAGAEALIPACTELPLALPGDFFHGLPLVDPVTALARGLIREAAPDKLRPLCPKG